MCGFKAGRCQNERRCLDFTLECFCFCSSSASSAVSAYCILRTGGLTKIKDRSRPSRRIASRQP